MLKNGYDPAFSEAVFEQIKGFGEYGFPESHAASFALLVYASAWIKLHYPAAFLTGLLNSQPMGFYAPAQLVRDAQNHGVTVLPVDVNFSEWYSTIISERTVRLGFSQVRGASFKQHIEPLLSARQQPFKSIPELSRRSGLTPAALALLAKADVFNSLGLGPPRRAVGRFEPAARIAALQRRGDAGTRTKFKRDAAARTRERRLPQHRTVLESASGVVRARRF